MLEHCVLPVEQAKGFVFIGPPTSGKSTFAQKISLDIDGCLIKGRDVLPDLVPVYEGQRGLIPETLFIPALSSTLENIRQRETKRIIFDNIPRTSDQATLLAGWAFQNRVGLTVVVLELTDEEIRDRFYGRLFCEVDGESFHHKIKPSKIFGVCDLHQVPLKKRIGDKEENIAHAIDQYNDNKNRIIPILSSFADIKYFDATGTIIETYSSLREVLEK